MLKHIKICKHCGNTFETNKKYVIECPFCFEQNNKSKVGEYLRMLDDTGWSELIDERWRNAVRRAILDYDPSALEADIDYVLELVIW
jgi:predicted  nucleic acid-binding Zn-ribbon protein